MGARWDHGVPPVAVWAEVVRVLKPGALLFAFGGTRTYHRLACAIEDAGFEIRDSFLVPGAAWLYGQGFAKGINISKAIDAEAGAEREVIGEEVTPWRIDAAEERRVAYGAQRSGISDGGYRTRPITGAATAEAARWEGYNSTLKPAWEPVVVAMKPLDGTFASNALRCGVAGLNIDGGRIGYEETADPASNPLYRKMAGYKNDNASDAGSASYAMKDGSGERNPNAHGRWPTNLVLVHHPDCREAGTRRVASNDRVGHEHKGTTGGIIFPSTGRRMHAPGRHADAEGRETVTVWDCVEGCPVRQLDEQGGERSSGGGSVRMEHAAMGYDPGSRNRSGSERELRGDTGSASRFFYCAKVRRSERNLGGLCDHPTLKPIDLCRYLATLLLPPRRLSGEPPRRLLVPFSGAGSEIIGARLAGWDQVVGIEKDPAYCAMARRRIGAADPEHVQAQPVRLAPIAGPLFAETEP